MQEILQIKPPWNFIFKKWHLDSVAGMMRRRKKSLEDLVRSISHRSEEEAQRFSVRLGLAH